MGAMPKMFSRSSYDRNQYRDADRYEQYQDPMPNPENYKIIDRVEINGFTILRVYYPGCTNYEGNKILVYESLSFMICNAKEKLDPHFCEDKEYSPVARFEPTIRGWDWACEFCKNTKR